MIGRTNVGGGSARINIANYAILPASGRDNQIALINSTSINDVYCQPTVPDNPAQGDVWIVLTRGGTAYLVFGNITFYIASIRQFDNGAWTYISAWYVWQNNNWITGRLTLIENGAFTGQGGITFTGRLWAKSGRTIAGSYSLTEEADCIQLDYYNTSGTQGSNGYGGICSSVFDVGAYSTLRCNARFQWTMANPDNTQIADIMVNDNNATNPDVDALAYHTFISNPPLTSTWYSYDASIPISQSVGDFCVFVGIVGRYNNRHHYIQIFNLYLE